MKNAKTDTEKMPLKKRIVSVVLIVLSAILALASVGGYILRGTSGVKDDMRRVRTAAVLRTASDGVIDSIATEAKNEYFTYMTKTRDPETGLMLNRTMGQGQFDILCQEKYDEAAAEARAQFGEIDMTGTEVLEEKIVALEEAYRPAGQLQEKEMAAYSETYIALCTAVGRESSWIAVTADAEDSEKVASDEEISARLIALMPSLADQPDLTKSFVKMAKAYAEEEKAAAKAAAEGEESGEAASTESETEIASEDSSITVDETYFVESPELKALKKNSDTAVNELWDELVLRIPELDNLKKSQKTKAKDKLINIIYSSDLGFSEQYEAYDSANAVSELKGFDLVKVKLAANASTLLLIAIAIILFTLLFIYWKPVTTRLGIPRTIILLFFIYLCLAAAYFRMDVSMLLGDVLMRVGMYGILVLAMVPGIQCGIGLNMGMTIGCIAGLLATMLGLQWDFTGTGGLMLTCLMSIVIAVPMGIAYALLLNRMKGSEMTITTYVGYSFVALMCIFWLMLPFTKKTLLNLQLGYGLRVTHSLLNSYAYKLNEFLAFKIPGTNLEVPTGLLLAVLLLCGVVWLFSRSRLGIAMSAVGSNPRFAEAGGINVDSMRILGTTISTVLAAVGIVIYSSAFGYAQIYNAPRQLGFIAASAILIGGATVSKAKVSHVLIGTFLFEGVLTLGQQVANAAIAGGGLSEVMRILISNGIILYALAQSGGDSRE